MTAREAAAGLERAILRAEEWAGTPPAKEAVKLRPSDWHAVCDFGRKAAAELKAAERAAWRPIEEGQNCNLWLVATDDGCVGEARWFPEDDGWWWAGSDPTDAHDGRVYGPILCRPLPTPGERG